MTRLEARRLARRIEPAEREHGGRALHDKPHAKARQIVGILTGDLNMLRILAGALELLGVLARAPKSQEFKQGL